MRSGDLNIMYADTFISYLDGSLYIELIGYENGREYQIFKGWKKDVLKFLEETESSTGIRYMLCDTHSMYMSGNVCSICVE